MVPSDQIVAGTKICYQAKSDTISKFPYDVNVEIVWVEDDHVHYRIAGRGAHVHQTPLARFREIIRDGGGVATHLPEGV